MKTTSLRKYFGLLPLALCFLANAFVPHLVRAHDQQHGETDAPHDAPLPRLLKTAPSTFSLQQEFKKFSEPGQPASERIMSRLSYSGKIALKGFKPTAESIVTAKVGDYEVTARLGDSPDYRLGAKSVVVNFDDGAELRLALARESVSFKLVRLAETTTPSPSSIESKQQKQSQTECFIGPRQVVCHEWPRAGTPSIFMPLPSGAMVDDPELLEQAEQEIRDLLSHLEDPSTVLKKRALKVRLNVDPIPVSFGLQTPSSPDSVGADWYFPTQGESAALKLGGTCEGGSEQGVDGFVLNKLMVKGKARGLVVPVGKIKLWHAYDVGGTEEDALQQAVALLEEDQPKLEVTLERIPFGEFDEEGAIFDKWNKEVAAGGGPDMFTAPNDHTGAQARQAIGVGIDRAAVIASLDKYLKVDAANFFPPASFEGATVDGKIYGVPGIAKAVALYYNKNTIPNPPTTTAELLQMVKDGKTIAINQTAYHNFGFFTGAFGGTLLNANGVCIADQGGFAEALQFLKELKDAGAIFNTDDSVSNQLFTQDDVDMIIQGPWKLGDFREALGDANLGVAKMPAGLVGAATPLAGVDYWYVNPNISDKQKKLAVAVAMYLFGPKGAQLYSDVARSPMVTLGVKAASERVQTFADAAEAGFPRPQSTEFGNYWGPFGTAINEVLNDEADPVTAVQKATQAMNAANGK
jgi:arabinogalactan oligomer/maltooligosaccharide transport system substrate-binding protein